jgi:hypothetical protein
MEARNWFVEREGKVVSPARRSNHSIRAPTKSGARGWLLRSFRIHSHWFRSGRNRERSPCRFIVYLNQRQTNLQGRCMDTSRLEELLEQLLDKQDELLTRLESLESTVEQQLTEANAGISSLTNASSLIHDELNWWGEGHHSFAKQVLGALAGIESAAGG